MVEDGFFLGEWGCGFKLTMLLKSESHQSQLGERIMIFRLGDPYYSKPKAIKAN